MSWAEAEDRWARLRDARLSRTLVKSLAGKWEPGFTRDEDGEWRRSDEHEAVRATGRTPEIREGSFPAEWWSGD